MNIKKILKELVTYYECTRQVGHTTAVIEGVKNKPKTIVITHSREMSNYYNRLHLDGFHNTISLDCVGNSLRGHNRPIVFDNAALHVIFNEALEKIESLEAKTSNQEKDVFDDIEVLSGDIEEVVIKGVRYKKVTESKTTWKKIS